MKKYLPSHFPANLLFAKAFLFLCFLAVVSLPAFSQTTQQATVSTDQSDYPPGSTVFITGSGFAPNESVTLQVLHVGATDNDNLTSPAHQPWTVSSDANGNISATWTVPFDEDELNATLKLTAVGQTSGLTAQTTFTDANPSWTVSNVSGTYGQAGTITLTATLSNSANHTPTFTITPGTFSVPATSVTTIGGKTVATLSINLTSDGKPYSAGLNTLLSAGSYTITASVNGTTNGTGTLTVNTAPLTITAKNQSKIYGAPFTFAGTEFTVTTGQLFNPDKINSVTLTSSAATATALVSGSPYTITITPGSASGVGLANYDISYGTGSFAVTPEAITITAKNQTKTYGAPITFAGTEFTVTTGQLFNGDVLTATLTSAGAAGTATVAGSPYTITPSAAAGAAITNYTVSYANGSFAVTPEAITITANNQTKVYGMVYTFAGTEFKVTTGQLYNSDVLTATLTSAGAPVTATVAGSPYTITPSAAAGAAITNYTVSYANGSFAVTPEAITITANNQTKVYGMVYTFAGTEFKVTTGQLYNSDVLTATLTSAGAAGTATVAGSTYPITPSAAAGTAITNYTVSYANGSFEVTPEAITITANNQTKVYGMVYTFAGTEFKVTTGQLYNSDVLTATLTSAGAAGTATVAGSPYTITPSAAAGAAITNYTVSYGTGSFTVTPEAITITAKNQTKVYGMVYTFTGTEFTVTTGMLYNGDVLTATLTSAGAAGTATVAGSTYPITPSAAAGAAITNYTVSYGTGSFTVTPEAITITAKNQTKVYGMVYTFTGTEFTVTTGTLYNGDVLTATLTSAGAAGTATVAGSTYPITPSAAAGAAITNYTVSYGTGSFTVTPEAITITAKNQTKVYGIVYTFTGTEFTVTTGMLYNGDVLTATLTSAGAAGTATVAGSTYPITPSAAAGTSITNYTVSYANGSFAVTPEAITITANNQTKVYGMVYTFAGTEFKVTTGQLYNGDVLTTMLTSAGAPVTATVAGSPYQIVPSAAAGTSITNYTVSYANGSFAVTPEAITITANNQTKVYGMVYTFAGTEFKVTTGQLYNSDVLTTTLTSAGAPITATVAGSPYPIVPSAAIGTGITNYTVSYANGSFAVTPEAITITANNQTKVYGMVYTFAGTEFKVTTGQLYNGDVLTATLTSTGAPVTATVAGSTYPIVPSAAIGTGITNYTVSYANGSFAVTPEAITITANNQTKVYGMVYTFAGTEFKVTTGQLYNSDVLTATLTSAGAPVTATVAGSPYPIVPSAAIGTGITNYTVSYANGSFAVTPEAITITANNQTKVYGMVYTFAGTEFKVTTGQLYNSDVLTATLTSAGAPVTATVAGSPYPIVPSAATGAAITNYTVSYANGSFAVTPEAITITANDQTKIYGTVFHFAGTEFKVTTGQLYNSDVLTATLTSAGAPVTATATGSPYPIVPSAAIGTGVTNYTVSYANGSFAVTPEAITITANNQTKVYGMVYTFSGTEFKVTTGQLYNSDVLTATLTSTGAPVTATVAGSPYPIVPSAATGAAITNYTVSYANGSFAVTPEAITITANDQTKIYGTVFHFAGTEFKVTTGQLYNSDVLTATLTSAGAPVTATATGSPYPIIPSGATGTGITNYTASYANGTFTVKPDSVCAVYNGITFANTDLSSTGAVLSTTNVKLSIVINTTGGADATKATVKFTTDNNAGPYTASLDPSSTVNQATYFYNMPVNIGSNLSQTTLVTWVISGNFANSGTCGDINTEVTVSTRTNDFVTGGGYVVLTASSGTYKGDAGSKNNFGFNVKWNKSLTNLQGGGFNSIVRSGNLVYHIQGPKILTLAVVPSTSTSPATAAFTSGNANVTVTNAITGAVISTTGNLNLTVQMTDLCEPGAGSQASSDLIAITLKDTKGNLLFSNDWNALTSSTIEQSLNGGNLQVHGDANAFSAPTCSSSANKTTMVETPVIKNLNDQWPPLNVTVYPNPTVSNFNLQLAGGSNDKLDIIVTDILGHIIEVHKATPGSSLTVGDNLHVGMYLIQVRQGQTYKFYRVFKQ